jgi:hypothetical protein
LDSFGKINPIKRCLMGLIENRLDVIVWDKQEPFASMFDVKQNKHRASNYFAVIGKIEVALHYVLPLLFHVYVI